jgi:hypothetical protein
MGDRRDFLLKVAKGVAYSAPVMRTLASPPSLVAQATSGKGGMEMGMLVIQRPEPATPPPLTTSTAPWAKKPGG